jgi:hypothetical protein
MSPFLPLLMSEFKVPSSARSATKACARVGWIVTVFLHRCVRRKVCDHMHRILYLNFSQAPTNISEHISHLSIYLFISRYVGYTNDSVRQEMTIV